MAKVWQKNSEKLNPIIEKFEVGLDYLYDSKLFKYEIASSIAHSLQLEKIGILTKEEANDIVKTLKGLYKKYGNYFPLSQEDEDIHSKVESLLTQELGDIGKKIHTGRSRNDQVITIVRLFEKEEILITTLSYLELLEGFIKLAEIEGDKILPGYTHTKQAMLINVRFWLTGFIELGLDNIRLIKSIYELIDSNPLGSGSGFGVPLELDRDYTAKLLGFSRVQTSPMAVQNSRGKYESLIVDAFWNVMNDFSRMASDLLTFNMDELLFVKTTDAITTGSSIMPQKKNFDVMELIRAKANVILAYSQGIKSIINGLISGYNRDTQEIKELLIKSFVIVKDSINALKVVIENVSFDQDAVLEKLSKGIFATELAYKLVKEGMSFRDAYKEAAQKIENINITHSLAAESLKIRVSEGSPLTINLRKYKSMVEKEKKYFNDLYKQFTEKLSDLLE
ncbi:MAG: argininosuccinate lyase [Brevinematales bacterium]|nr:argininosuccinate lyase [Brevinematales bacterium]